ncbi:hypothetical protein CDA63_05495 [Hymenobacter amundsenii]|uniref:SusE outer membrane protein domain-containing protein n=1 Tax=Hymenobacter amundsenii TaxID=2006685 RepID=A0A246FND1_9BACT|nr:SusE domain-containing protein [Hymenobacter amundsenii]OWP64179.1 hypothetical protein CDA63_05495 [Hymenobacter amundsenii]
MKTLFAKVAGLGMVATMFFASCEKEGDNVTINQTSVPQLTASTTTPVLSKPDADKPAVTYNWKPASYGFAAAPSYTLEFDVKGNNFKSARTIGVGSATKYTLTVGELNGIFNDLKQAPDKASELEVRLKSTLSANAGLATSAVSSVKATPYESRELPKDVWAIIGAATPGSWDKDTPMTYDFDKKVWVVTLPLVSGEFKFRANNAWAINLGDAGTGSATGAGRELVYNVAPTPNPPNLVAPATAGTYTITLDTNASPKPMYTIRPQ